MQWETEPREKRCARCCKALGTSLVYKDGSFWHVRCLQEGEHLLANAERLARAVNPTLFIHERLLPK